MKPQSINDSLPTGVTWETIEKETKEGKFDHLIRMVSPTIFKQILVEQNKNKAIEMVKQTLINTDPVHATDQYAEQVLSWMKKYAQIVLNKK